MEETDIFTRIFHVVFEVVPTNRPGHDAVGNIIASGRINGPHDWVTPEIK